MLKKLVQTEGVSYSPRLNKRAYYDVPLIDSISRVYISSKPFVRIQLWDGSKKIQEVHTTGENYFDFNYHRRYEGEFFIRIQNLASRWQVVDITIIY
ncbi:hypothetical protein [Chengkuizengella sediminis]|uniref:hypothetical protein n=1 Tax=Chengkuizengella sediminis TaxID=1885917 RepID=UPI001389FFD1|nr:hypothetical protein [Chengkuizengella sediminis]NDI35632.1 hypothetical protein [Chengkuizengella sediminis]